MLQTLVDLGLDHQLQALSRTVNFKVFSLDLSKALAYSDGSRGEQPLFDPVLMFKTLVIQMLNNFSDERAEYLINDRLSFRKFFLGGVSVRVLDSKIIWLFRDRLTQGCVDVLLNRFDMILCTADYLPMSDQTLDTTNNGLSTICSEPFRPPSMHSIDGIMVEGDIVYRSKANEDFMSKYSSVSKVYRKKPHFKCHTSAYPEVQRRKIRYPIACRARLCRLEGTNRTVH